ncbi:MAG: PA2779 family protein [Bdellovibrionaceae bacterium]|nr:PA2779 family protein [Pseudobdellovibrionaceae bacterium]
MKLKLFCIYMLSVLMTHIPDVALAETAAANSMIPTSVVLADLNAADTKFNVENFLKRDDVQKQLMANGISATEATARVAALSPAEMKNLALQMEQARAGGDILITILVIILIIFLIQRI